VDLAGGDLLEQDRKPARDLGCLDATLGLVLRHAELINTISVQTRTSPFPVQTAGVHFGQMSEQAGERLIGAADLSARAASRSSLDR
jgi:hypothetical protein